MSRPSKKIITITFFVIAIFLFGFLVSRPKTVLKNENSPEKIALREYVREDKDGDAVPDWEEALWGTDDKKIDSDDDGISDKEEIESRKKELAASSPNSDEEIPDETAQLARELFVLAAKTEGSTYSAEVIDEIIDEYTSDIVERRALPDAVSRSQIKIVAGNEEEKSNYKKATQNIFQTAAKAKVGSEFEVLFGDLPEGIDPIKSAEDIVGAYHKMALSLSEISVPEAIAASHLALINNAINTAVSIDHMLEAEGNPLIGVVGILQYNTHQSAFLESAVEINKYNASIP